MIVFLVVVIRGVFRGVSCDPFVMGTRVAAPSRGSKLYLRPMQTNVIWLNKLKFF